MNKTSLKFFGSALLLALVGAGAVWGIDYYQKVHSPEYQVQVKMQELEARARADTYGGSTPEETLALFIDALKRGDIDLASKYFVVDEQEKWKIKLLDIQKKNVLSFMVNDLEKLNLTKQNVDKVFFTLANEQRTVLVEMVLAKNEKSKWKILEL